MAAEIIFYLFAAITLLGGLGLLLTKHVVYAAYSLMATLLGIAGVFITLGADFVGTTQILVYVGGILVLVLFGVMLTRGNLAPKAVSRSHNRIAGGLLGLLCMGGIFLAVRAMPWGSSKVNEPPGSMENLGQALMTDYLLAFEVVGVLLLVVLIGTAFIARWVGQASTKSTR